ncbi:hypothetical protein [Haloprofundus halobius]|uniref:hypothetical protein n=1 Tax=Haloprofundus halobius TaxID=2876194 RepID=UPI001CCA15C4|nr:hypothetical protein [Haloprofundus halobius]
MKLAAVKRRLEANEVAFIHDPEGSVHFWKLRSLPALQHLGVGDFTYPTSWRQLKQTWEYEKGGRQYEFPGCDYHVVGNMDLTADDNLAVVTTSYYEHQTKYSIKQLVDRYTVSEGTLVVVADDRTFQPVGGTRPLYQEQFVDRVGSYERVYEAIEESYADAGWQLPLRDTKNLFAQDNAVLYKFVEGTRLTTVEELLDVLPDAPYLPMYGTFCEIFAAADAQGSGPLENDDKIEALGGWLRRRIEWDRQESIQIARELNRAVADDVETFDLSYAARSPKHRKAKEAARELTPEENDIESKYHDWLTNDLP